MQRLTKKLKNKKGIVLVGLYMVLVVLSVFSAQFVSRGIYQNKSTILFKKDAQAFGLAEAGLDHAITWFRAQGSPPSGDRSNPWGGSAKFGRGHLFGGYR